MSEVAPPPPGAPPKPGKTIFVGLNAKKGVFTYSMVKDGPEHEVDYITGYLLRGWIEWDPGRVGAGTKDTIPPRWELNFEMRATELAGKAFQGERVTLKVSIGPIGVVTSLAEKLLQVTEPHTFIGVTAFQGTDSTLTELSTWNGHDWSHIFNAKKDDRSLEERSEEILAKFVQWPLFNKPANRRGIEEPPLPGTQSQAGRSPDTQAQAPLDAPKGFGHQFARAPKAEAWTRALSEDQAKAIDALKEDRRAGNYDTWVLVAALSREIGAQNTGGITTGAHALLLSDLLKNGSPDAVNKLRLAADAILAEAVAQAEEAAAATGSQSEYDPFADE